MVDLNQYIIDNPSQSNEDIALRFGVTKMSVAKRRQRLKAKGHDVAYGPEMQERDMHTVVEEKSEIHKISKKKHAAESENRVLYDRIHKLEKEIEGITALKGDVQIHRILPKGKNTLREVVAVALLSDTHYEEEVRPNTVNGRNKYNLDIAKIRNDEFFEKVLRMIRKERQDVEINHLVLGVLGDLITGNIHESVSMDSCLLGPMDAIIFAQQMIRSGITFLREQEPDMKITVVCKYGNHSRTTRLIHIGNEGAYATEKLIYCNLRDWFQNDKLIEFIIEDNHLTTLNIGGLLARFSHGHFVKYNGGVGGITIPLNKAIMGWNDEYEYASFDCMGHFHSYTTMRRAVVNGSMIGYNTFAIAIKAKFEPPIQSFFLVDPYRGEKTVHIPILFSQ